MVELVCGLEQRKKIEAIPLSNDTINSRISDMSTNILEQVIWELDSTPFPFSMQLDESTDISQCSQLLVFMLGKSSGFTALIKKEIPDIIITHCFLHRHALASKTLPTNLKEVMTTAVKVVNFIRAEPYVTDFSKCYVKKWDLNTKFFFITQKCVGFPDDKL
ncbi:protein FAM200C-like [Metopolophium dirhodum]|uniref:protein FAM200C-like n=1 Tax=Metopolophium dirhodum TaxID=44670 RepID=UPI00298FC7ED|nr:protein FAM200C-like [Metopolophium dirhodum]